MASVRRDGDGGAFQSAWDHYAGASGGHPQSPVSLSSMVFVGWIVVCVLAGAAIVRVAVHL